VAFPDVTFHDLGHTTATMLLSDGVPIPVVSERLGHSKVSATLDFYAHVLPETKATLGDRFEQRLAAYETPLGKQLGKQDLSPSRPGRKKPRQSLATTGFPNVPRGRIELPTPGFSVLTAGFVRGQPDRGEAPMCQHFSGDPMSRLFALDHGYRAP